MSYAKKQHRKTVSLGIGSLLIIYACLVPCIIAIHSRVVLANVPDPQPTAGRTPDGKKTIESIPTSLPAGGSATATRSNGCNRSAAITLRALETQIRDEERLAREMEHQLSPLAQEIEKMRRSPPSQALERMALAEKVNNYERLRAEWLYLTARRKRDVRASELLNATPS